MFKFCIRGARGTIPSCGNDFSKYGGNTTCFSLHLDDGLIIFDAGTGLTHLAHNITAENKIPDITLFFTHFHMDHVIGLPCFNPIYNADANIAIIADPNRQGDWRDILKNFMDKPYWPVGLGETDAVMTMDDLPTDKEYLEIYGVKISWFSVPHPQQCLAYRIDSQDKSIVIATDCEYDAKDIDPEFINFCKGADHLLFDAHYTPDEYPSHRGWGHSTWETAVIIAGEADVAQLILTHHAPYRDDEGTDAILKSAQSVFPNTIAASDNLMIE